MSAVATRFGRRAPFFRVLLVLDEVFAMEKRSKSSKTRWIAADAGFGPVSNASRSSSRQSSFSSLSSSQPFVDSKHSWLQRNAPQSSQDLCVHPKKIEALADWLKNHVVNKRGGGRVLLLTGPSGSGKTAAVRTLAKELNVEVQEWINPSEITSFNRDDIGAKEDFARGEGVQYVSNVDKFRRFMLRANRYAQLLPETNTEAYRKGRGKFVLIEELPSFVSKNSSQFKEVISQFRKSNQVLVLIDSLNTKMLRDLADDELAFNAANQSLMMKMLGKVASKEGIDAPKEQLQQLAEVSAGDIRVAINLMQIKNSTESEDTSWSVRRAGMKRDRKGKRQPNQKGKKKQDENQGKDTTLDLFHALGKILYAKREEATSESTEREKVLGNESLRRPSPLASNPQRVVENIPVGPEMFVGFLHQNCPEFFSNISQLASAIDNFSLSEQFFKEWTGTSKIDLKGYGSFVCASSLTFYNTDVKRHGGLRTFKQPELSSLRKLLSERQEEVARLSRMHGVSVAEASLTLAPYLLQFYVDNIEVLSRPLREMTLFRGLDNRSRSKGTEERKKRTAIFQQSMKKDNVPPVVDEEDKEEEEEEFFDIDESE